MVRKLIQLSIIGVFTSFTLSQYGMVRGCTSPRCRALAFARADCLDVLEAVAMATDEQETQELAETWQQHGIWCRSQCWKLS